MPVNAAILWEKAPSEGRIEVVHGKLAAAAFSPEHGRITDGRFVSAAEGPARMELAVDAENTGRGAHPTVVGIRGVEHPFAFLLRDISREYPIFIPSYGVAVTTQDDRRGFHDIRAAIGGRGLLSRLQQIDLEAEESYETAAAGTRALRAPVWLGLGRDVRIFELDVRRSPQRTDWIVPRFHGHGYFSPEREYVRPRFGFMGGRGWGCTELVRRWLDDGSLPILHWVRLDDDVRYEHTAFVTLERSSLTAQAVRGTHFLVADGLSWCHVFTDDQEAQFRAMRDEELNRDEETALCCRIVATNCAAVPRYAFFKAVFPTDNRDTPPAMDFDSASGFGSVRDSDEVFAVSRLDGHPLPQEEIAVLLEPGRSTVLEFLLPHRAVSRDRASALAKRDFQRCLDECRAFWRLKLAAAGQIRVPEKRVDEMIRAGLLHLELVSYGIEPDGPLAGTNSVYAACASESAIPINYLDSLGLHSVARRTIQYYLEKQREDGLIQNFTGYMLEAGCLLWLIGEHYRYTRDEAWLRGVAARILKSCQYVVNSRVESRREELRGRGYGLISGKVADSNDAERTFMLNGYAYLGLSRAAEMLATIDPSQAARLKTEAEGLKADVRAAFFDALAKGPVIPLGDGTWCPTVSPWVGPSGPVCLFADGGNWYTHGAMTVRDDILGPLHLVFQEVIAPDEPAAATLLNYHSELLYSRSVSFSQPYLSHHPFIHLRRDEVKRFLKAYYNNFSGLADRETYTWWEHYFHEAVHKTPEEAEFLMQTRCMLYMEEGDTLKLLRGVPRAWLQSGKQIELRDVASYFGRLSVSVASHVDRGVIEAEIVCESQRKPQCVEIRLPHPGGTKASGVEGGRYVGTREAVEIVNFTGRARVRVQFPT